MDTIDKIRYWYFRNHVEITWFFIGFFMLAGLHDIKHREYISAMIDFGIVALNYIFRK